MRKIHKWDPDKFVPGSMVGLKIDGLCGEVKKGAVYSTEGHKFTGLKHIEEKLNVNNSLMGELYIPGMEFNKASGIIRSKRKNKPGVRLALFDYRGLHGIPFHLRYVMLKDSCPLLDIEEPVSLIPHMRVSTVKNVDHLYAAVLSQGFEGLVIKGPDGRWMKRKKKYKGIHLVVGIFEGKAGTKYEGMMGGVIIDMGNGVTTKVGGGFDDDQRSRYWEDHSLVVDHEMRVEAMEHTPNGRLRHANCQEVL